MLQRAVTLLSYYLSLRTFVAFDIQHPQFRFEPDVNEESVSGTTARCTDYCTQYPPLHPRAYHDLDVHLESVYRTEEFGQQVADALGAVVRVP